MAFNGSTAPVLVVPALAMTQNGRKPAARSADTAAANAPMSMRKASSTATLRSWSGRKPRMRSAFWFEPWVWAEQ